MSTGKSERLAEEFNMNLNVEVSAHEVVEVHVQRPRNRAD